MSDIVRAILYVLVLGLVVLLATSIGLPSPFPLVIQIIAVVGIIIILLRAIGGRGDPL